MIKDLEFMFEKSPIRIFLSIDKENNFATILTKKTDSTFSNVCKILKNFEDAGLIKIEKNNKSRTNRLELTEKGKKVRNILLRLKEAMEE